MSRTFRDKAIVISERHTKDADKWYTLYTQNHGKITVLGRGTRRGKSKMSPHMNRYSVIDVLVAEGRNIKHLAGAELINHFYGISEQVAKRAIVDASMLMVDEITRLDSTDEKLFSILMNFLESLNQGSSLMDMKWFYVFVLKLFDIHGVGLELNRCVGCRTEIKPDALNLNILRGGLECNACRESTALRVTTNLIKSLRFYRDMPFSHFALLQMSGETTRELEKIIDLIVSSHIERPFLTMRYLGAVMRPGQMHEQMAYV